MSFYRVAYTIFHLPLKLLWRVSCDGRENIPEGGFLVASNHTSMADVILLALSFKRQIKFMAKREAIDVPVVGGFLKSLGAFPVNRGGADIDSIKYSVGILKSGEIIGIFPQGTRCPYKDLRETEVKSGIGLIAYHSKAPVVPVYIKNSGKTKILHKNRVIIGKPVTYEDLSFSENSHSKEFRRASEEIFSRICLLAYPALPESNSSCKQDG